MRMRPVLLTARIIVRLSIATSFAIRKFFQCRVLAYLRAWLAGSPSDSDASITAVLGCTYLLLTDLVDIFDNAHQMLPVVVANSVRALILLLILSLLPAGRY